MKLTHKLDPLLKIQKAGDNILTFGCYILSLNFMLKPEGPETVEEFQTVIQAMAKACCDVIDAHNKAEDAKCLTNSNMENPGATMLSSELLERKSPTPPLVLEP